MFEKLKSYVIIFLRLETLPKTIFKIIHKKRKNNFITRGIE